MALNPCITSGHPTMLTEECIAKYTMTFSTYGNCLAAQYMIFPSVKIRWPKNIYKDGGGSFLTYLPCKELS